MGRRWRFKDATVVFFCLICWLLRPNTVDAVMCYECNSSIDVHCTEELDTSNTNIPLSNCSYLYATAYCIKTTGIYKGEVGTTRFCSSENLGNICDFQQRMGDVRAYRSCVYTCSRDGCNSATSLPSGLFLVITTLTSLLIYQRL